MTREEEGQFDDPTTDMVPTCAQMIALRNRLERADVGLQRANRLTLGVAIGAIAIAIVLWSIHRVDVRELRDQVFEIHRMR